MIQNELSGILVVDKPVGITSAGVVSAVKKNLKTGKVGHAGTLDPFAEGVLVCCINQATRLAGFLLKGPKKYSAVLRLGQETDTQDSTGTVVSTVGSVDYSAQTIQAAIASFKGPIEQLPPVFSALKHKGVPLYKLARRGQPVQKPPRRVQIYDIRIDDIALPDVHIAVSCSAGTYIRTLAADIGKALGCGGHLSALRRTESSGFTLAQAVPISALSELADRQKLRQKLIRMKDALPHMAECRADDRLAAKVSHGRQLGEDDAIGLQHGSGTGDYLKIVDRQDDLIAIVQKNKSADSWRYCCVFPKRNF